MHACSACCTTRVTPSPVKAGLAYLLSLSADDNNDNNNNNNKNHNDNNKNVIKNNDDDDDDDNNYNNDNNNDNVFQLMKMLTSKDSSWRAVQASSP